MIEEQVQKYTADMHNKLAKVPHSRTVACAQPELLSELGVNVRELNADDDPAEVLAMHEKRIGFVLAAMDEMGM